MNRSPRFGKFVLLATLVLLAPFARAVDFSPLEKVPIQEGGRKKPYLVFAQESLMAISGKTAVTIDGKEREATDVITSLWLSPDGWQQKQLILVNNKPLKEQAGLDVTRKLFSYDELAANSKLATLVGEANAAGMQPGSPRLSGVPKEALDVGGRMAQFGALAKGLPFNFVANPDSADGPWTTPPDTLIDPMRKALLANDDAAFAKRRRSSGINSRRSRPQFQPPAWKIELETTYQKTHPFRLAWIFYAAAGIVLLLGRLGTQSYIAAWILTAGGFLLQVLGFASRVLIGGRAPVTNMYESIIWVAFGTILFALIFEAIYRSRVFLLGAIPVAVISLVLADTQPVALSSSITPLRAVLRDNFWLSTHVLAITLSYAAFALSLGVGHIILGKVGCRPEAGGVLVQLPLPHLAGRSASARDGDDSRRGVGELLVGPLLGLGPEGNLGAHYAARLSRGAARARGGVLGRIRSRRGIGALFPVRADGLVRREFRAWRGPAQLRLRNRRIRLGDRIRRRRAGVHGTRDSRATRSCGRRSRQPCRTRNWPRDRLDV